MQPGGIREPNPRESPVGEIEEARAHGDDT